MSENTETTNEAKDKEPSIAEMNKRWFERDQKRINKLIADVKQVVEDLYSWRNFYCIFQYKVEAFALLSRLTDFYYHLFSERFTYLYTFQLDEPTANIEKNLKAFRDLYSDLVWENESKNEPEMIDKEDGIDRQKTEFKDWYVDDTRVGAIHEQDIIELDFSYSWKHEKILPNSEQELMVKNHFMNLNNGKFHENDESVKNFYGAVESIDAISTSRYLNDIKRAVASIIMAYGYIQNDYQNTNMLHHIDDGFCNRKELKPYKKQVIRSYKSMFDGFWKDKHLVPQIEKEISTYLKKREHNIANRLEALNVLKDKYEQKIRKDVDNYELLGSCYVKGRLDKDLFICKACHRPETLKFIYDFETLNYIEGLIDGLHDENSEEKKSEPTHKSAKKKDIKTPVSSKTVLSVTFAKRDITDAHLTLVYQRLVKENWISPGDNANDFLNLFSGRLCKCKVIWTNAVSKGNLAHLIRTMWLENHISIPEGYGYQTIIESHFVDTDGNYLTNVKGGSKSKKAEAIIKDCMKLLSLDAGTDA